MREKKVIAVIVEGPSEEAALGPILKKYFASEEVQFAVVHGDITLGDNVSMDTIISKIGNLIESIKTRYGYRTEDFLKIIHIADTDGAFVAFISDPSLAVPGTYKETWRFIEKGKNSLNRYTNMNLIFDK